jgi:hypothetical protein
MAAWSAFSRSTSTALLRQSYGREAKVLEGFAKEEAAKILILMDAVRCPPKLVASKLNRIVGWFYDHLARLIYAEAVSWKPLNFASTWTTNVAATTCPTGRSISARAGSTSTSRPTRTTR